jgi:hypothetical protein
MSEIGIQCGMCGHTSDFDLFCVSPLGLPLPRFHYQCPVCNHAWQLVRTAAATVNQHGQILPPKLAIKPNQMSL